MKSCRRNIGHVAALAVALVGVMGMTAMMTGQEVPGQRAALIDDWTHHYLVFSNPGTEADAIKNGRYEHWHNVTHDPRYRLQQLKRRHAQQTMAPAAAAVPAEFASRLAAAMAAKPALKSKGKPISKDWSVDLNGPSATGTITNSNAGSTSSVTINTTTLGVVNPTAQVVHLSFSSTPANTSSLQIGTTVYDFTTSAISSTPPSSPICNVRVNGTNVTNLYDAITVSGTAGSTTYRCYTGAAANSAVTSLSEHSSSTVIYMTAVTPGSTGITYSTTGSPNITWSISTAGTDGTSSGTAWAYWSGAGEAPDATVAANIAYSINNNATLSGQVTAVATGNKILVTALTEGASYAVTKTNFSALSWSPTTTTGGAQSTVQPNTYPAKYGASLTSASCADFIIYPTGMTASSSAASIVAYDNLYASCSSGGTVPSEDWAYNTGGAVTTSPVLSLDGSQVAYVQSNGATASLVLLKWAANSGTLTAPATITSESASTYRACGAPCYLSLTLSGSPNDTFSAPFADYDNDIIYVGDDSGYLHQFTGVFQGAPTESTSPWPVHLGANKLSPPVYDSATGFEGGYIFVGDMGGVFYSVGSGYGGTTSGTIYGNTGSLGNAIADAPLVDAWEGTEYVFVTTNGSYSYPGYDAVWEFVSIFTTLVAPGQPGAPGVVAVGLGGAGYYLYAGTFDNVYFDSGNPAVGNIYVVGNTGTAGGATLYQVKVAYSSLTGTVNSVATGLNSTGYPWPSPVSEFCNNGANPCSLSQRTATGKLSTTSPNVTLTSGSFTSADVGAQIWASPSNILYGATITAVLTSTTANLEFGAPANETGQTFTIQDGVTTSGTDYVFFSVNRGTGSGCTSTYGNGCILSYNVTNPTSVSQAGSGLNVKTPGTSNSSAGCWATGGIVIDNADTTTTGASQIYFLNLNGIAAGGPVSGTPTSSKCTAGTATSVINAVQASQSNP